MKWIFSVKLFQPHVLSDNKCECTMDQELSYSQTASGQLAYMLQADAAFTLIRCQHFSLGLERYWYWVIGYWAIFTDIG